jgi:hypothetical protein
MLAEMPQLGKEAAFPQKYREAVQSLWADASVQQVYQLGHTFALMDNAK